MNQPPANSRQTYLARLNRVVDYVDRHLAEELPLEKLAEIAHFSPWHFHRLFVALTGETVADFVRRRRLEGVARLLLQSRQPVLELAIRCGFNSAEVLSRNFRQTFGVSPSSWRKGGWQAWAERQHLELSKIHQEDRKIDQVVIDSLRHHAQRWPISHATQPNGESPMQVHIRQLPAVRLAYLRHVGPYGESGIPMAWHRFAGWCESAGLTEPRRPMYGIGHDNPYITAPERCRYDCCVAVDDTFQPQAEIGVQTLPGGRYACADFTGTSADVFAAWQSLFRDWLPDSGHQLDDRPVFEFYPTDFAINPETGVFTCQFCLPVKTL